MSRHQIRFAVGTAVMLLLIMVGYYTTLTLRSQQKSDQALQELAAELAAEETDQRMRDFRRIKMRNGKKVWELAAHQARYFEESGEVVVDAPRVSLYVGDGEVIALQCREGRVQLDAKRQEVARMELHGDLEMQIGDFSLKTQQAIYDSASHLISSAGVVRIVGKGLIVEGRGYTVDVATQRVTLTAEVQTTVIGEERSWTQG